MPTWADHYRDKKTLESKASKMAQGTHLTYCWLRADNAQVQINQLLQSHKLTPVCLDRDQGNFISEIEKALKKIENIKYMIKQKDQQLKDQANKK